MQIRKIVLGPEYGDEYAGEYIFRELTWAKHNRIIQKNTVYNKYTGKVENQDLLAIQAETIMASLQNQPANNPLTLEKLLSEDDGVPYQLGEYISSVVNSLSSVNREETAFLSEASADKNPTPPSPSTGSVKSLAGP